MAGPAKNNATHKTPDLWQEAYKALEHSEEGKERLPRLNEILRIQLGKPKLKIRSAEGLKELQTMIIKKAQELAAKQASGKMTKAGKAFENMAVIKDIVGQGLSAGGPYTAIPAAALFLAFSVCSPRQLAFASSLTNVSSARYTSRRSH